jgi:predicted RNA-binding Zn ribbon-like protein
MIQPRSFDPELPFLAYPLAVDFANSTGPPDGAVGDGPVGGDLFADRVGVRRWLAAEAHAVSDIAPRALDGTVDLPALRAFRATITDLLRQGAGGTRLSAAATARVNSASAAAPLHPELLVSDGPGSRSVSHAPDWQTELVGRIARSAIELLSGPDGQRLGICRAPACGLLFVASRGDQRWCSGSCGNRARVARHYHRRRGSGERGTARQGGTAGQGAVAP